MVLNQKEADRVAHLFENTLIIDDIPKVNERFSYAVMDLDSLKYAPSGAKLELKVDTGMHRNGILPDELSEALEIVKRRKLNLYGVMTHYRSADVLSSEYFWQRKRFEDIKKIVKSYGFENVRFHSHNSAALLRSSSFDEDIARVGISAYGYDTFENGFDTYDLRAVLSLWAKRVSSRELKRGERVGYGGDFSAPRDMIVSTYDLGYGDGWFRGDSNKAFMSAENLPILGRVSMDFLTLESTKDDVCIMDDAKKTAEFFGTIPYEITTRLNSEIKRIIV